MTKCWICDTREATVGKEQEGLGWLEAPRCERCHQLALRIREEPLLAFRIIGAMLSDALGIAEGELMWPGIDPYEFRSREDELIVKYGGNRIEGEDNGTARTRPRRRP